jgi:hypothetical protein
MKALTILGLFKRMIYKYILSGAEARLRASELALIIPPTYYM